MLASYCWANSFATHFRCSHRTYEKLTAIFEIILTLKSANLAHKNCVPVFLPLSLCVCVCCTLISCAHSYVLIWLYDFICVHIFCRLFWRFTLKSFIVSYAALPLLLPASKQQFLFKVLEDAQIIKISHAPPLWQPEYLLPWLHALHIYQALASSDS